MADGNHTVKIKAELTFELIAGDGLEEDAWMSDAEILLDAFAAEVGRDNTANPPLRLCFAEGVIYECQLVDEVS